jgi:hypothetical protein
MTKDELIHWTPRILAILVCVFLSLFAWDADALPDLALHLAPVVLLLIVVAVSWRRGWVAACAFTALAMAYAVFARDHVSWVLTISLPLLVVGALYGWSWRSHRHRHA